MSMRRLAYLLPALVLSGWLARATPARAQSTAFIAPGREEFVAEMLGRGLDLPSHCRFDGAAVLSDSIRARYRCSGLAPVIVVLRHVRDPGPADVRTREFAVSQDGARCPPELLDALESRIREREAQWHWGGVAAPAQSSHAGEPTLAPAAPITAPGVPGTPWLLLGALALAAAVAGRAIQRAGAGTKASAAPLAEALAHQARSVVGGDRLDYLLALAGFAAALLARVALGAWGPFHANGQAPLWIMSAAWDARLVGPYGPGYPELFHTIAAWAPSSPDTAIFATNAFVSALAVPLLFAMARASGLDKLKSSALAALLAVDPSMLRVAATESYFPPIITLLLASRLALMLAVRQIVAHRWLESGAYALMAALLATQAARIHPFAWLGVGLIAAGTVTPACLSEVRLRLALLAGWLPLVSAVLALTSLPWLRHVAGISLARASSSSTPVLSLSSLAFAPVLVGIGALALGLRSPRARWTVAAAMVELAVMGATRHLYAQNRLQAVVFERFFLPGVVVGAAAALSDRWFTRKAVRYALAAAIAAVPLVFVQVICGRTTEHLEYRWLRDQFRSMAQSCVVMHVDRVGDRLLELPEYAAPGRSSRHRLGIPYRDTVDQLSFIPESACVYVLWSSLCDSAEGRSACERMTAGRRLEEVASADFPARPTHPFQPYDRDPVHVVLWRTRHGSSAPETPPR